MKTWISARINREKMNFNKSVGYFWWSFKSDEQLYQTDIASNGELDLSGGLTDPKHVAWTLLNLSVFKGKVTTWIFFCISGFRFFLKRCCTGWTTSTKYEKIWFLDKKSKIQEACGHKNFSCTDIFLYFQPEFPPNSLISGLMLQASFLDAPSREVIWFQNVHPLIVSTGNS